MTQTTYNSRITAEPGKCGGRPCVRGKRIRVSDVQDLLAAGADEQEILRDYPFLDAADIRACQAPMTALAAIESFVHDLVARFHPVRVTLFGSYADGKATADSDVDLLVEMPVVDSGLTNAARMIAALKPGFLVDLIVWTPEQVKLRSAQGDHFLRHAVQHGRVLYEVAET